MKAIRPVLKIASLSTGLLLIAACSWVAPIEGSNQVALVKPANIGQCQKLGSTVSFVQNTVAGLSRNTKTMTEELITLGKNQAVEMKGDTIVQTTELNAGKMGFDIYRCGR